MDTVQVGISLFKSGGKLIPGIGAGIGMFDNLNNIFDCDKLIYTFKSVFFISYP
jgi:hypothetical protein